VVDLFVEFLEYLRKRAIKISIPVGIKNIKNEANMMSRFCISTITDFKASNYKNILKMIVSVVYTYTEKNIVVFA